MEGRSRAEATAVVVYLTRTLCMMTWCTTPTTTPYTMILVVASSAISTIARPAAHRLHPRRPCPCLKDSRHLRHQERSCRCPHRHEMHRDCRCRHRQHGHHFLRARHRRSLAMLDRLVACGNDEHNWQRPSGCAVVWCCQGCICCIEVNRVPPPARTTTG